jgi:excisionase family DNA binding protein
MHVHGNGEKMKDKVPDLGLVWGADAIAQALGVSRRQAFHLLEKGLIPARKVGAKWCTQREDLRRHFSVNTQTEVA